MPQVEDIERQEMDVTFFGFGEMQQKAHDAREHWRSLLSDGELCEVKFAQFYIAHFRDHIDRLCDGRRLAVIAHLARILDDREIVSCLVGEESDRVCSCDLTGKADDGKL